MNRERPQPIIWPPGRISKKPPSAESPRAFVASTGPRLRPRPRLRSDRPELSVLLGTVDRPRMVQECVCAVREAVGDLTYEVVVAYGRGDDPALPWLAAQADVRAVLGGVSGAVDAFNAAYAASRGLLVAYVNDDVLVAPGSLAAAAAHLLADPTSAGVVFRFDRRDGRGPRHERLEGGALHPNQAVLRRSTCEAVVELLGGLWGDASHRVHKTYGGDSALGVACVHLGLRLDEAAGVDCVDRQGEADDALRRANRPDANHGARWTGMFRPLLLGRAAPRRVVATDAAARLRGIDPREGERPARRAPGEERVLHVHLAAPGDPQAGLVRALERLGAGGYAQVDWMRSREAGTLRADLLGAAAWLRPTLVFMQLQAPDVVSPALARELRTLLAPRGQVVTWCGDVAGRNSPWDVGWQLPLAAEVGATLHSSLGHVHALRAAGAERAAWLQIGYDQEQYRPASPGTPARYDAVFLGGRYYSSDYLRGMRRHDAALRDAAVATLRDALGPRFGLYGSGHVGGLGPVPLERAHEAYHGARAALSVSLLNDLPGYQSDRMFRALGCGVLLLQRRFPLASSHGLEHEVNCVLWETPEELRTLALDWLRPEREADRARVAAAGAALALERHTWDARTHELAAVLAALRGEG